MCITYILRGRECTLCVRDLNKVADVIADLLIGKAEVIKVKSI